MNELLNPKIEKEENLIGQKNEIQIPWKKKHNVLPYENLLNQELLKCTANLKSL